MAQCMECSLNPECYAIFIPSTIHNYNLASDSLAAHRIELLADLERRQLMPNGTSTPSDKSWPASNMADRKLLRRGDMSRPDIDWREAKLFHGAAPPQSSWPSPK